MEKFLRENPQIQKDGPIAIREMMALAVAANYEDLLDEYEGQAQAGKDLWRTLCKMVDDRSDEQKSEDLTKAVADA